MIKFLFLMASYLAGAVPFGLMIARKVADVDITQRGSGNIGATNVARELGLKWGLLTLLLDLLKGYVPVFLFALLHPRQEIWLAAVGFSALLGHQFSVFERFKGGKGVATALGVYLALSPVSTLIAVLVFVLTVGLSKFVSLGSMLSAVAMPIILALTGRSWILVTASIFVAGLICLKHRDNMKRLLRGEERKWEKKAASSGPPATGQTPHRSRNE